MSLYGGTTRNALADVTDVFSKRVGLPKAQGEKLQADITEKLMALSEPLHLDPHELRDLNTIILAHLLDLAQNKATREKTDRWADEALADLKTRHVSLKRVREVIHDTNEWIKAEHPAVHRALKNSNGLGNHPSIVRKLTDRYLAHETEKARAGRGSKWLGKARTDRHILDNAVPSGGLLAGNPGSDKVAATALRTIGPLGANLPGNGGEAA